MYHHFFAQHILSDIASRIHNHVDTACMKNDLDSIKQLNQAIPAFLTQNLYQLYPDVSNVAYKAFYEVCEEDSTMHVYPNETMVKLLTISGVKPHSYIF